MKQILMLIIVLITCLNSSAQNVLNKKEVSAKLREIESEINNKNFEKALNIFQNKNEIILRKKVRKKDFALFENISSILYKKEELMIENKNKIENRIKEYKNNELCDATLLLNLKLTKENSFLESRKKYNQIKQKLLEIRPLCNKNQETVLSCKKEYDEFEYYKAIECLKLNLNPQNAYSTTIFDFKMLLPKLKEVAAKCTEYTRKIKKWQTEYNKKEYNKLFTVVLGVNSYEKSFIPPKYKEQFERMVIDLKEKEKVQQLFNKLYITPTEQKINEIRNSDLTYFKAQDYIQFLTEFLKRLNNDYKLNYHNAVFLHADVEDLRAEIKRTISTLSIYSKDHAPQQLNLVKIYNDFAGEGLFGEPIYTELQAEQFWKDDYKGKLVIGFGTVDDVKERIFHLGTYITIQVSSSHYVDLYLAPNEENKSFLLNINKGDKIKFIGVLDKLGTGIIIHHTIKNVRIIGIYK